MGFDQMNCLQWPRNSCGLSKWALLESSLRLALDHCILQKEHSEKVPPLSEISLWRVRPDWSSSHQNGWRSDMGALPAMQSGGCPLNGSFQFQSDRGALHVHVQPKGS